MSKTNKTNTKTTTKTTNTNSEAFPPEVAALLGACDAEINRLDKESKKNKESKTNTKTNTKTNNGKTAGTANTPIPKNIPPEQLFNARWNVHEKEKKSDEAFKGLVASIKAQGLIQRVAVREIDEGCYEIIDGHRRTAAAIAAGLKEIPCDIFTDFEDADAQIRTITANAQRIANDPIREAEAYELLAKQGKTQKEIAAIVGFSEQYVARRSRIIALIPEWRKTVKENEDGASVTFLETLASYSPQLQKEAHDAFEDGRTGDEEDGVLDWLMNRLMTLKDAPFDCTGDCATCPFNTVNKGLLFAGMFEDEGARCEKRSCFVEKWNAAADAQIEKLRASGVEVKEVKQKWDIPCYYDAKPRKDKKHTAPYVYVNDNDCRVILWTEPRKKWEEPQKPEKTAQTQAEKKAANELRKRHLTWFRARRSARDKVSAALHGDGKTSVEKIVRECVGTDRFNEWVISYLAKYGPLSQGWSSDEQNAALLGMAGPQMLEDFGLKFVKEEVDAIQSEDPALAK